jgi:hypothetical protein
MRHSPFLEPTVNTTQLLAQLESADHWGYHASGPAASEPAAWACLALSIHGRLDAAARVARWLVSIQQPSGAIGITDRERTPTWPTSLAILAWVSIVSRESPDSRALFQEPIRKAIRWSLAKQGMSIPRRPHIGHNATIVGWSWADDTHSWLEPTCFHVIALKAAGQGEHPRVQEGLRLIVDRLLPTGGCNYGNTQVLGQTLLPHLQPTGLAMMALAGTPIQDDRIEASLQYLTNRLQNIQSSSRVMPTASLCFGLLGLTSHRRRPLAVDTWLKAACDQVRRQESSMYKLALIALAAEENGI